MSFKSFGSSPATSGVLIRLDKGSSDTSDKGSSTRVKAEGAPVEKIEAPKAAASVNDQ